MASAYSWHEIGEKFDGGVGIRSSYPTKDQINATIAGVLEPQAAETFLTESTYGANLELSRLNRLADRPLTSLFVAAGNAGLVEGYKAKAAQTAAEATYIDNMNAAISRESQQLPLRTLFALGDLSVGASNAASAQVIAFGRQTQVAAA